MLNFFPSACKLFWNNSLVLTLHVHCSLILSICCCTLILPSAGRLFWDVPHVNLLFYSSITIHYCTLMLNSDCELHAVSHCIALDIVTSLLYVFTVVLCWCGIPSACELIILITLFNYHYWTLIFLARSELLWNTSLWSLLCLPIPCYNCNYYCALIHAEFNSDRKLINDLTLAIITMSCLLLTYPVICFLTYTMQCWICFLWSVCKLL